MSCSAGRRNRYQGITSLIFLSPIYKFGVHKRIALFPKHVDFILVILYIKMPLVVRKI